MCLRHPVVRVRVCLQKQNWRQYRHTILYVSISVRVRVCIRQGSLRGFVKAQI